MAIEVPEIPKDLQIEAMLSTRISTLLEQFPLPPDVSEYVYRRFLTIDRGELIAYLETHPERAQAYLDVQENVRAIHDIDRLWEENGSFLVGYMDRGRPIFVDRFRALSHAVAEHLVRRYGLRGDEDPEAERIRDGPPFGPSC